MATKKIFLVDTENVGSTWKDLLPAKAGSDQILLFFTENSPYVSYSDLQLILQFPDRFEMIKCNPGKNGLDFQLVSYLGYLMKTASKANYVIVSNDGGFDAVVKFWQDRGMSVSRMNVYHVLQPAAAQVQETAAVPASPKQENQRGRHGRLASSNKKNNPVNVSAFPADAGKTVVDTENLPKNGNIQTVDLNKENGSMPLENALQENADAPGTGIAKADSDARAQVSAKTDPSAPTQDTAKADSDALTQDSAKTDSDALAQVSAKTDPSAPTQDSEKADSDALTQDSAKTGSDALTQDVTKTDAAASADTETAPRGKSGKTTRATSRKKALAPSDDTAKTAAAKAPAKRQKKTSAAPLAQPLESAILDPENMELDFSNLTVSEKASLLRKYLPKEFSEDQESLDIISDIMFGHDTTNHHQLHLAFVKNFGDEKGTLIYKAFRPHLAEFRA